MELFLITDSIEDTIARIKRCAIEGIGLKKKKRYQPIQWLGEHLPAGKSAYA